MLENRFARFFGAYKTELIKNFDLNIISPDNYRISVIITALIASKLGFRRINVKNELAELFLNHIGINVSNVIQPGPTIFIHPNNKNKKNHLFSNVNVGWKKTKKNLLKSFVSSKLEISPYKPKNINNQNLNLQTELLTTLLSVVGLDYLILRLGGFRSYRIRNLKLLLDIEIYGIFDNDINVQIDSQATQFEREPENDTKLKFEIPWNSKLYSELLSKILPQIDIYRKYVLKKNEVDMKINNVQKKLYQIDVVSAAGGVGSFKALLLSLLPIKDINLFFIDRDIVAPENFGVQLFDRSKINMTKVDALTKSVKEWAERFELYSGIIKNMKIFPVYKDINSAENELKKFLNKDKNRKYIFLNFDNIQARKTLKQISEQYNNCIIIFEASEFGYAIARQPNYLPNIKDGEEGSSCQAVRLDDIARASPVTNAISAVAGLLMAINENLNYIEYYLDIKKQNIKLNMG